MRQKQLNSLLLEVAGENDAKLVKACIKRGTDVNARANDGYTPLHIAVRKGYRR